MYCSICGNKSDAPICDSCQREADELTEKLQEEIDQGIEPEPNPGWS